MLTTGQVVNELGIGFRALERLLQRQPELRPQRFGTSYAWTHIDVAKIRRALNQGQKEKRAR